jgi:hypothetical protein
MYGIAHYLIDRDGRVSNGSGRKPDPNVQLIAR